MIIDQVSYENGNGVFAYSGPLHGTYLWQRGNVIEVGRYEHGAPFITDALFIPQRTVTYENAEHAEKVAYMMAGKDAFVSWMFSLPNCHRTAHGGLIEHVASKQEVVQ